MKKRLITAIIVTFVLAIAYAVTYLVYIRKLDFNTYWVIFGPAIVFVVVLISLFSVLGLFNSIERQNQKLKSELTVNKSLLEALEANEKNIQRDLPIGIVVYTADGIISYANEQAKSIFQSALLGKDMSFISSQLKEFSQGKETFTLLDVYGRKIHADRKILQRTIYFRDVTEEISIVERAKAKAPAIIVLSLENIDSSIDGLNLQRRTELLGQYYVAIDNWASKFDVFSMSTSDEKQMFITTSDSLEEIIEDKFSILQTVDDISKTQSVGISLSIGVGINSDDFKQLGFYADQALDLAQNRGGGQAVIFDGESEKAFGGSAQYTDRIPKPETKVFAQQLIEKIQEASSVVIMPHIDTDADAIGSALGILEIAEACGTPAKVVLNEDRIDSTVEKILESSDHEYIKLRQSIISPQEVEGFFQGRALLILCDHHDKALSVDKDIYSLASQIIVIDHHRLTSNLEFEPILKYIDANASSAGEIATELTGLVSLDIKIPNFIATVILIGMIIDTHNFSNHTTDRTFAAASRLLSFGADPSEAQLFLRESINEQVDRIELIKKAQIYYEHYAIIVDNRSVCPRDELSKTADALLSIDNIEASFAIGRIGKEQVSISARSHKINVHVIMEQLGGGGHFNMAGAQIHTDSVEEVKNALIGVIKSSLEGKGETMKVILIADVKKLGKNGDTVDVQTGYGNYLLTKHLAIEANASNLHVLEEQKAEEERRIQEEINVALKLKEILEKVTVTIPVKTGANGKIFGSISTKDVEDGLKEQHAIDVDKKKLILPDNKINALGTYDVLAKLYKGIDATFHVEVIEEVK